MTPADFLNWARDMRDLGAIEVSATETGFSAKFAPQTVVAVRPPQERPKAHDPLSGGDGDPSPMGRKAIRNDILKRLGNG